MGYEIELTAKVAALPRTVKKRHIAPLLLVLCSLLFFAAAASTFIPHFGIEEDEVLFAPSIYHPTANAGSIQIMGQSHPLMLMSYVGADKTYLYAAILKRIRPSLWTLRIPAVLIGALTIWLLFVAARRFTGEYMAVALAWVMASDPMFLLTTTFDWGPVAVQHLMFAIALVCFTRPQPFIAGGFAAFGFALWDKGTASWTLAALGASAVIFLTGKLRPYLTAANLGRALGGFTLGSLPFLIFNFTHRWATYRENTVFTTEGVEGKIIGMYEALDGRAMFGWFVQGPSPEWHTLVPLGLVCALALLFRRKVAEIRPAALFFFFTGLLTWLAMLFVKGAGGSIHHTVLAWPWPHLFLICVLGFALRKRVFVGFITALVLSNIVMTGFYEQRVHAFGPGQGWSEAVLKLPGILPRDRRIVSLDWGIHNTGIFLTRGRRDFEDLTFSGLRSADLPGLEQMEFFTHVEGEEVIAGNNARFDAAIHKAGYIRVVDHILSDDRGHPVIVSFHCIRHT